MPDCRACINGCDDGDVCNGTETCSGEFCRAGTALACDDGNPCTDDGCDPHAGCTHVAASHGGARCTLDAALVDPTCAGARMPVGIGRSFAHATMLLEQAATTTAPRARQRLVRRALTSLAGARAQAGRARRQHRLSRECAAVLQNATRTAKDQAGALLRP